MLWVLCIVNAMPHQLRHVWRLYFTPVWLVLCNSAMMTEASSPKSYTGGTYAFTCEWGLCTICVHAFVVDVNADLIVTLLMAPPDELCFSNAYQACLTCTVELLQHGDLPGLLPSPCEFMSISHIQRIPFTRFTDAVDA